MPLRSCLCARYPGVVRAYRSTSVRAAALGSLIGLSCVACGGKSIVDGGGRGDGGAGVSNASGAANSAGDTSTGGASGSNNSAAGDPSVAGGSCSAKASCGGNLIGAWSVVSSCLFLSGRLDVSVVGVGCSTATVTGYRAVTGTW